MQDPNSSILSNPRASFTSQTTEDRLKNEISIFKILCGEENRTTVMIRNTPNKFKQMTLLEMINERHLGKYDYFYLPMDLKVNYFPIFNIFLRPNAM